MSAQPVPATENLWGIAQDLPEPLPESRENDSAFRRVPPISGFSRLAGEPHMDLAPGNVIAQSLPVESRLRDEFKLLAERWHKETRYWSSATKMAMHPAYQRIIALGENVIPYILSDLRRTRGHWLWALYILSRLQDPAPDGATFDEAIDAWLNWGAAHYGRI